MFRYPSTPANYPATDRAFELLQAVAHPVRFQIIWLLDEYGPLPASRLAYHLKIELELLQPYLDGMHRWGLLLNQRRAKQLVYCLMDPSLGQIVRLLPSL